MSTRAGWSVVVADATLLLFLNPSLEIFTFQLKKQNNTNEGISLAVNLLYGVETHAEINRLSQGRVIQRDSTSHSFRFDRDSPY